MTVKGAGTSVWMGNMKVGSYGEQMQVSFGPHLARFALRHEYVEPMFFTDSTDTIITYCLRHMPNWPSN
jgi:hypothetical protein